MTTLPKIRPARRNDIKAITDIYNHYVEHTAITFDTSPHLSEDRLDWFDQFKAETIHQCLVICVESEDKKSENKKGENEKSVIKGYACSSIFRQKPAYDTSVETTIYLHPNAQKQGLGRMLYTQLLNNLDQLNIHRVYGIITLPNEGSIRLHESLGYTRIGILSEVGYKFNQYWDTLWLERKSGVS